MPDFNEMVAAQTRMLKDDVERVAANRDSMLVKQRLMQDVMKNPDTPEWHDQGQKIVMAQGDRVIDRSFNRVFDSMTIALATLESKVQNMERASGYITASLPALPPEQRDGLRAEALRAYASSKGYPPTMLDRQPARRGRAGARDIDADDLFDLESTISMMGQHMGGVTLSLVRQGERQTKVKLRFDSVYYPRQVQEYYRMVWAAVDRQIFLDQALD